LNFFKVIFFILVSLFIFGCSTTGIAESKNSKSRAKENGTVTGRITGVNSQYPVNDKIKEHKLIGPQDFKPARIKKKKFLNTNFTVSLYAKEFRQGNAVYFEITKTSMGQNGFSPEKIIFNGEEIPFSVHRDGCRGILGIHPGMKPGYKNFVFRYRINGKAMELKRVLYIGDVKYPVSKSRLNLGKFSNRDYYKDPKFRDLIVRSAKLKKAALETVSEDRLDNVFSHPRDMHKITGRFWNKRIYLSYSKKGKRMVARKTRVRYHRGLDFKGPVGSPVYSIARGKVVLAEKMFFEGNMVIVDHGNRIFSYYMHMSNIDVKTGDIVMAGDILGKVGSTGMSTGPHLHLSVLIRGVQVDPLSLICLPVRN